MNKHQKTAFGVAAVLAFACLIVWGFDLSGLTTLALLATIVALLTLPLTWKLILSFVQMVFAAFGCVAHSLGNAGDWVADRSFAYRQRLTSPQMVTTSSVPGWDSPDLIRVGAPGPSGDLDVPSFMVGAMDRQN